MSEQSSVSGNNYQYTSRNVIDRYALFVEGDPNNTLVVVSEHALGVPARKALIASADKLGFGRDAIAWVCMMRDLEQSDAVAQGTPGQNVAGQGVTEQSAGGQKGIAVQNVNTAQIPPDDLWMLIEGIDPIAIIATDISALAMLVETYETLVAPNDIGRMNGRTIVALSDFSEMLADDDSKQLAWRLLKNLHR